MNLTAEQIQENWNVFMGNIEKYISSPRKEKLIEFYEKYQEEIWQMLWDSYSDCGSDSILHFISTFNGADGVASDLQFRNLLAWYAAEEVCRQIMGDKESQECFDEISTALHQT